VTPERPRVHVIALGGTIAMTGSPARPARSGEELVAAVPGLGDIADVSVEQLSNVPGSELTPRAMAEAVAAAERAADDGAAGIVVLQGTDTIEESADLAALVWRSEAPIVFTGAMRPGGAVSADGPGNLLDAVALAASPTAQGAGSLVCFDGLVHAGHEAVKSHSWRTEGFASDAPLGRVREGLPELTAPRPRPRPLGAVADALRGDLEAHVPIVTAAAGIDSRPIDAALAEGVAALVVVALGAGHLPTPMLPALDRALAGGLPVAVCARTHLGGTLTRTYGFEGSESDLARRGAILAGAASPLKARIRLVTGLALGADPARAVKAAGP